MHFSPTQRLSLFSVIIKFEESLYNDDMFNLYGITTGVTILPYSQKLRTYIKYK